MKYLAGAKAAQLFVGARKGSTHLDGLPPDLAPRDLESAYEIQAAVAAARHAPLAGFKVGLTNIAAQSAAGASEPIVGRLCTDDLRRSPARIALPRGHLRAVEAEVVFEIGGNLPIERAPFSEEQVFASIRAAFAGIEVCDSRFVDTADVSLPALVADNSNADLLVIGDRLTSWDNDSLAEQRVILERTAQPPVVGSTAHVLGQPLRAVTWLANWLASRGVILTPGQLISSGSCTGVVQADIDDIVIVTFESGARVTAEFTLADGRNGVQT